MQTPMRGRPRPVTATVTKPRWMQVPDPDALAKIRRKSLESHGSTESLTSLLDHDSYASLSDENLNNDLSNDVSQKLDSDDNRRDSTIIIEKEYKIKNNNSNNNNIRRTRSQSPNKKSGFSAWEKWVIYKEKEERLKRQQEKEKLKQEKFQKEKEQQEKLIKLQKAEANRQVWTEKKIKEESLTKKMEKAHINEAKQKKEKIEEEIKQKAEEKFTLWLDIKRKEDLAKKKQIKEESKKIEQHEENRKQRAEDCYQRWVKQAKDRPKTAPNSYGVMAGKVIGYHDRSAYPQPSFINPVAWQPVALPASTNKGGKSDRAKRKNKPYNWNPDKYL